MDNVRDQYRGQPAELAAVLSKFRGPSICSYGDEARVASGAKLIVHGDKGVLAHGALLGELYKLQNNLSFPKNIMKTALHTVFDENLKADKDKDVASRSWASRFSAAERADWEETMQRRIRNLCRCTGQALQKSKPSAWVAELPWKVTKQPAASAIACEGMASGDAGIEQDGEEDSEEEDPRE
jgi:hypothetical protein